MAEIKDLEEITIRFDGGLAASGKLHFYEFGRSQYAFARFVATIEHFRRTGEIAEHISRGTYVDIYVSSPQEGSFLESILVPAAVKAGSDFIGARLSAVFSYVWQLIAPRRESTDETISELAKIRLAEEATKQETQRTRQAREATRQQSERTKQLKILKEIADGGRASADDGLTLLQWANSTTNRAVGRLELRKKTIDEMADELKAERERIAEFHEYERQLDKVDEDKLNKLTSRLRPMVPEMTLPLRRSAERMYLGTTTEKAPFVFVNPEIAKSLVSKQTEEEPVTLMGRVKSYDRDAGVGKFTSDELPRTLNFIVPLRDRKTLRDKILSAMRTDKASMTCRRVVDQNDTPTSLILIDVKPVQSS